MPQSSASFESSGRTWRKQRRANKIREQRDRLAKQVNEIETQAEGFTTEIGLPARSPSAFSDWVALHAKAKTERRQRENLTGQHRETLDRAEQLRRELVPLVALETPTFDAALSAARRLAEAKRVYLGNVRAASDRTTDLNAELDRRQRKQNELEDHAEQASETWRTKVQDLIWRDPVTRQACRRSRAVARFTGT